MICLALVVSVMITDILTSDTSWMRDWAPSIAPGSFLLISLLHHALGLLRLSKLTRGVCNPFSNFITLDDLPGPIEPANRDLGLVPRMIPYIAAILSAFWLGFLVYALQVKGTKEILSCALFTVAWMYIFFKGVVKTFITPPYFIMLFALVELFFIIITSSVTPILWNTSLILVRALHTILLVALIWISGTLPLKAFKPTTTVAKPGQTPSNTLTCPEDDVTLWSWCTHSFIEPIFVIANTRTIDETDVWSLSPFFQHKIIFSKLLDYRARYPDRSLLRFLLESNFLDLTLDLVLELWSAVLGFVPPYALQEILSALAINDIEARRRAFNWALLTFIIHLSFAQVDLFQAWHSRRCYERTRGQLFCSLHFKSLKRRDICGQANGDNKGEENADLGKIVNLMQGDAYAVAQRFWEFSGVFTSPVRLVIALAFLHSILGWSSLAGVAVVLVVYVLNYPLAKYSIKLTRSSWKASDKRMSMVNELLQNIRFLKFYGWESRWAQRADDARETELQWRVKSNVLTVFLSFIWVWIASAMALATFSCYTLIAKEKLTVSKAFTTIALLSHLQGSMMELPQQIFSLLHAYVSMQRIEKFLDEPEVPDWASTLTATVQPSKQDLIGFVHATFVWESVGDKMINLPFQLGPLDLVFPQGQLTLIGGPTGSGKSAMLVALLGELCCMSGDVYFDKTRHRVAYCGQNPWLEHATIRDNIIYHSSRGFDEERYQDVIKACALNKDLEVFGAGDMTEIGEKGVTLSGGQKARVALARALYSEAECILLDDPLAAVDMHTAQHIVNECLKGKFATGRTVLLVTHHLSLCLPIASRFVELEHGRIVRQGPAKEFMDEFIGKNEAVTVGCNSNKVVLDNEADSPGKPTNLVKKIVDGKLIEKEARHEGQISWRAYYTYMRAAGIYCWVLTLALLILIRGINVLNQIYLAKWGEAYEQDSPTLFSIDYPWTGFPSPDEDVRPWITLYLYISIAGALSVLLLNILGMYASLQASRTLFKALLRRLSRAPVRFFDVTPIGRILNRFTTDMITIDWALIGSVSMCLSGTLNFVVSFSVILSLVPTFIPCAFIIAWLYVRLAPCYIRASRDLRRLELVSLSPTFAGFDELLHGITHVRAFGMEQRYQDGFFAKVDKFQAFDHVYWLVNGWLRWRYDCLGSVIVFAATLFALWSDVSDGFAAIVIVQAGVFADANRQLVKVAAQLELDFNSVERVVEYLDAEQEAPAIVEKGRPPAYWPSNTGRLEVEKLTISYAPHLPPALRDVSFSVRPSEKVGVVGRTGSGKSTLALSLLRMVEPTNGKLILDNIDISTIGLDDLRTRVTIVSQDVSLFSGTLRTNLDPLGDHSTEECIDIIKRCNLASVIQHTGADDETSILDKAVSQDSLSAGEKQLVALARAMLRGTNVVIMDEATSQIDIKLDGQIQKMIREELSNAIVITIAHRLKTIIDYDRILVLDDGQIVEFDEPKVLLRKEGGAFREMCLKSVDWPIFAQMLSE